MGGGCYLRRRKSSDQRLFVSQLFVPSLPERLPVSASPGGVQGQWASPKQVPGPPYCPMTGGPFLFFFIFLPTIPLEVRGRPPRFCGKKPPVLPPPMAGLARSQPPSVASLMNGSDAEPSANVLKTRGDTAADRGGGEGGGARNQFPIFCFKFRATGGEIRGPEVPVSASAMSSYPTSRRSVKHGPPPRRIKPPAPPPAPAPDFITRTT